MRTVVAASVVLLFLALFFAPVASAQLGVLKHKTDEEKQDELQQKNEKLREKEARKYANLAEFAQDEYAGDPDFHDRVDQAYQDLQGEHAMQAFDINTSDASQVVVKEGDVIKIRRALYDNPRVQDYVNRVGQGLVPADAQMLYAFKVIQSPVPVAYTLSTGTIYISTGLISLTDNEAQLAYILSHEVAHVYMDHWKVKVMSALAEQEYNRRQERKSAIYGAIIGGAAGAIVPAARGGANLETLAAVAAATAVTGAALGAAFARRIDVDWDLVQENQADDFALKNTLDKNYDIQEVPKLYMAMTHAATVDQRVGLGFLGNKKRVKDRTDYAQKLIGTTLKPDYEKKLAAAQLVGTSPDYQLMMAELKRDNGIMALYFDMFDMAKKNLSQAVSLRSDDARARFYYGQVLKLVARTDAERDAARTELANAVKLDANRHFIPEAELQQALLLIDKPDSASQQAAAQSIKDYVTGYQDARVEAWKYGATLPSNMEILYDYLRLLGDTHWKPAYPQAPVGGGGGILLAGGGGGTAPGVSSSSKYDSSAKGKVPGTRDAVGKAVQVGAGVSRTTGALAGAASTVAPIVTKQ
jgi:Zn-dependent protease with chaperone function